MLLALVIVVVFFHQCAAASAHTHTHNDTSIEERTEEGVRKRGGGRAAMKYGLDKANFHPFLLPSFFVPLRVWCVLALWCLPLFGQVQRLAERMRRKALKAQKAARNNKDAGKAEENLETAMEREIRETAKRLKKRMERLGGQKKAKSRWKLGAKTAMGKKQEGTPALLKVALRAVKTKEPNNGRVVGSGAGDPLERELQLLTSRLRKTNTSSNLSSAAGQGGAVNPMQAALADTLQGLKKTTPREASAAPSAGEGRGLSAALAVQKAGLRKAAVGDGGEGAGQGGSGEGIDPLEAALRAHMAGLKKTKVEGKDDTRGAEKAQTVDPLEEALKRHLQTLSKVKTNASPRKTQERSCVREEERKACA